MVDKQAAKRHYKENPPEMGVLGARNKRTGRMLYFGTMNLAGKQNSISFQLEMGSFIDHEFQADYDAGAPDDLEFEILEVLKPDKSPGYDYRFDLKTRAESYRLSD
jgi:hypothetical protein